MSTGYVIVHDCGLNGAAIEPAKVYPSAEAAAAALADLFKVPRHALTGGDVRQVTGYGGTEIVELEVVK